MPNAQGRILGIAVPELPWRRHESITDLIERHTFRHPTEDALQAAIADLLALNGYDAQREVRLSARDRIDILVGLVGIEVKVAGRAAEVERQLRRYAEHDAIGSLILVTSKVRHRPPAELNGKPVRVVNIARSGL